MVLGSLYRPRAVRRRSGFGAKASATQRLPVIDSNLGGWRTAAKAKAARGVARAGARPGARVAAPAPAATGLPAAGAPATMAAPGLDRARLAAAGYLDADSGQPLLRRDFSPIAAPLVAQAFAPDAGRRDRLILVTSATAGEGKTFTAVNLALTLSRSEGRPVLLIDADPRTAGAARSLGLASEPGLSDALADALPLDQLVQATGFDNLTFLAPGGAAATMTGLLASPRMARLTRDLLARTPAGLIVIDGPALLSGTEAAALAIYAGQVVLLVAAGRTPAAKIERSLERLGQRAHLWLALAHTPAPADRPPRTRSKAAAR